MEQAGPQEPTEWRLSPELEPRVERRGLEFLADFYGSVAARRPENVEALQELGHVLTRLGRYEEGLLVDRELARRDPEDANVLYNLACSLALTGRTEEAFRTLDRAILHGYEDAQHMADDADLSPLHGDPRFEALIRALRGDSPNEPGR